MSTKFFDKKINTMLEKNKTAFLHAAGDIAVNEWVSQSPVKEGVYRNSIVYKIENTQSPYGSNPGGAGQGLLSKSSKSDTVRIGLNLVYANYIEKLYGTGAKSMDLSIMKIDNELARVFSLTRI